MTVRHSPTLRASHFALNLLIALNLFFGLVFVAMLVGTLAAENLMVARLSSSLGEGAVRDMLPAFRWVMGIAILSVPFAHLLLRKLAAMVVAVRDGQAFAWGNVRRLKAIAWLLLALQLLDLSLGLVARILQPPTDSFDWSFSLTGWLAILLLFVLANVFEEGARMREDLEGTV